MKIIRVFPRKTNATPDDENVRFSEPGLFDEADAVHVSVTWTWDIPRAEQLAEAWRTITDNIQIGGPAYDDPGGEFEPGMYIKKGYVITSRGCPNKCWFCCVPKREGGIRELEIKRGHIILDSNLLACSKQHISDVFSMAGQQKERPKFTGGLEAKRMMPWIAEKLRELNPKSVFFAYDTPDDYEPLVMASKMLIDCGIDIYKNHNYRTYVLCGYRGDTFEKAERRMVAVGKLGLYPMAMLYNRGEGRDDRFEWVKFQRQWANIYILMTNLKKAIA